MKILSERNTVVVEIEYELSNEKRLEVFDWLDKKYGRFNWKTRRMGPCSGNLTKGLMIVEVDL